MLPTERSETEPGAAAPGSLMTPETARAGAASTALVTLPAAAAPAAPTAPVAPAASGGPARADEDTDQASGSIAPTPKSLPEVAPLFSKPLFVIVTALLVVQLALLVGNLWFQLNNYRVGITLARSSGATADAVSLILVYSRAWDFAVTKTSALFLGFTVIYIGALYVLRSADTAYEISYTQGTQMGASLKSSSPGLVLITLGAVLVGLVLYHKSEVGLQMSVSSAPGEGTVASHKSSSGEAAAHAQPTSRAAAPGRPPTAPAQPPEDPRIPVTLDP